MGSEFVCGYKLVRQLGARALPSYAAIDPKPRRSNDALCVVERLARKGPGFTVGAEAAAEFLRDAKRLTQLNHPNVVRVREVVLGTSTVLVVMDWIEGEVWSDIQTMAVAQNVPIPLGGSLRVIVDLLEGLSALHEVCDAKKERLQIVHAEVAPRNLVVGLDGRAVLVHPLHAPAGTPRTHSTDIAGYLAPEMLLGDQTADQRADVYGAGVILWEMVTGRRMHPAGEDAGEIVMRLLGGKIPPPTVPPEAAWAAPLAEVARKAASPDPSNRYANATEMLAEVRRAAGGRLAPKLTVGALVEAVAGPQIRTRSAALAEAKSITSEGEAAWTTEAPTVNRQGQAHVAKLLDAEASKPTPLTPPAMIDSAETAIGPVAARPKPPPPPRVPRAPPTPSTAVTAVAEPGEEIEIDVEVPSPPAPEAKPPAAAPLVKSIPPPSSSRFDSAMQTNTDLAAAVGNVSAPANRTTKWTIGVAIAAAVAGVAWIALRPSDEPSPATGTASPALSTTASASARAAEPPTAAETAPPPPPTETAARTEASAADAPADRPTPTTRPGSAASPPIPTVTGAAPAPAPPPVAPPPPAPAASSTHPKKRVYDPMGI